jgi:hypothetical protein
LIGEPEILKATVAMTSDVSFTVVPAGWNFELFAVVSGDSEVPAWRSAG